MKIIALIFLLASPSFAFAEQVSAILSWDDIDDGEVLYSWRVRLQLGDPAYTHVTASHIGERNESSHHPYHSGSTELVAAPLWTQEGNPPTYDLRTGTHEYCSILLPSSEFTASGLSPLTIWHTVCHDICWDTCPSC